jgi:TonB-linked SusC/RagA family outer membrane protein
MDTNEEIKPDKIFVLKKDKGFYPVQFELLPIKTTACMKYHKTPRLLSFAISGAAPKCNSFLYGIFLLFFAATVHSNGYSQTGSKRNSGKSRTQAKDTIPAVVEYINTFNGPQKKQRVTGAYSQIYGSTVENNPIVNNRNRMQGLLPGLMVMQNNGEPGDESATMLMRGKRTFRNNEPIILVDGFERSMDMLDPNEIETITVMKDAAATAQYGLRGGNGIVQVTTKRGKEGKTHVKFNLRAGIKAPTTRPQFTNSYEYATLYNEALTNDGAAPKYSAADLEKYKKASQGIYNDPLDRYLYPNENWYEKYTKANTWQKRYSLSIDGGNSSARYFVSAGYTDNSGLYNVDKSINSYNTNTESKLLTIRSNVDVSVNKRLALTLDVSGRQEQRNNPGARTDASLRVFRALYKTPPNAFPVLTPDGQLAGTKDYTDNPFGLLNYQGYSQYYTRSMAATFRAKQDLDFLTKGLTINGNVAFDSWYDQVTNRSKTFKVYDLRQPNGTVQYLPSGAIKYVETGSNTQISSTADYPGTRRIFNTEVAFNYDRDFGQHSVKAFAAFNRRVISQEDNTDIPRTYLGSNGRASYAFKNRYLAEFNYGYQGSEQFLPGNKYGFFHALSAGWVLSEEAFIKKAKWINFLKIRGSHGLTGNDDLGGYFLWYQKYSSTGGPSFGYTSIGYSGIQETAFALNNVTYEKVRKTDLGIDATLVNNKINFQFDYFFERNSDIMIQPSLPNIMGIRFPNFPIGIVENKGFDLCLGYYDKIGKLGFSINGTFTKAKNQVINRGEEKQRYDYQMRTGHSLSSIFGLEALGIFKNQAEIDASPVQTFGTVKPGDIKFKDQNGDNVINSFDETYLGENGDPVVQFGVNLGLTFSGFDLSVLFTGHQGGMQALTGESIWEFHDNGTVRKHHLDRFNPADAATWENATYPRLSLNNKANNQRPSTYWLRDASLARLKTVEVGYTLPGKWMSKITTQKVRLYLSAYNLHTWSSTNLVDIEARSSHYVVYPIQRIFNGGINIEF